MTGRPMLWTAVVCVSFTPAAIAGEHCETISKLSSPGTSIQLAKSVDAGSLTPRDGAKTLSDLPAFCRVLANLKPTPDSDIHAEIWLPLSNWNGKYLAVGSGGWGGSIAYPGMADALRRGYATSATDDGHTGDSGSFVVGHPEKFID